MHVAARKGSATEPIIIWNIDLYNNRMLSSATLAELTRYHQVDENSVSMKPYAVNLALIQ